MEKNIVHNHTNTPLVSIWCPTFNNKEYVRDTIDGFLAQKTTFPYEIVIHDDASTDGTIEILKEYQQQYPHLIKLIIQEENIFHREDRKNILNKIKEKELKGKYIAMCEGDDYWIDENKLQKQVDILEEHEECVMVAHNYVRQNCETGEKFIQNENAESGIISPTGIICLEPNIQTASYMVRKEIFILDGLYNECSVGDEALKFYANSKGHIYYLKDIMSVYRYKNKESWTSQFHDGNVNQFVFSVEMIDFIQRYDKHTDGKYSEGTRRRVRNIVYQLIFIVYNNRECLDSMVKELEKKLDPKYYKYVYKILELYEKGTMIEKQLPTLLDYCKLNKNIYLWGTGIVSNRYSSALEKEGIDIKGYIVTEKEGKNFFRGKKVWEIKEFPYNEDDIGIIVAASSWASSQISNVIDEYNIKNYYCVYEEALWEKGINHENTFNGTSRIYHTE